MVQSTWVIIEQYLWRTDSTCDVLLVCKWLWQRVMTNREMRAAPSLESPGLHLTLILYFSFEKYVLSIGIADFKSLLLLLICWTEANIFYTICVLTCKWFSVHWWYRVPEYTVLVTYWQYLWRTDWQYLWRTAGVRAVMTARHDKSGEACSALLRISWFSSNTNFSLLKNTFYQLELLD